MGLLRPEAASAILFLMSRLAAQATRWKLQGFLEHFRFVHRNMPDHPYAWVLGAGASKASGIPLAGDLVHRWLGELQRRLSNVNQPLPEWATAKNLGIDAFNYADAAASYSRVYERRFGDNPEEGFAYLEGLMGQREPSPGYSILAQILEKTAHKVVISTNFDNLVADALSIYTSTFPLVIGHESLANFVKVVSRRPVICKIHRDLLLGPKSDPRSLRRLHESWAAALRALFSQYTPLFVGYGGNDDSLMDLLESLDPGEIKGQMIWCYYERSEPSSRIQELVAQHRGALVPVPDFDLLMVLLGAGLDIEPIDDAIEKRAADRAKNYRKQLIKLDTTAHPEVRRVLRGAFERAGGPLAWMEKASTEPSTDLRESIFRQALEQYPDSDELKDEFGIFLYDHGRDLSRARALLTSTGHFEAVADLELLAGDLRAAQDALARCKDREGFYSVVAGRILERQGNFKAAEERFSSGESFWVDLAWFYLRRARIEDGIAATEKACASDTVNPAFISELARFLWLGREDVGRVGALYDKMCESESADSDDLLKAAAFWMAQGDQERVNRVFDALAIRPMNDWKDEAKYIFLQLVNDVVAGRDGAAYFERLRRQFTYAHSEDYSRGLDLHKMLEAAKGRIPSAYRKTLSAIVHAMCDPSKVASLNVYPHWKSGAPAAVKGDP
ncbi:SIR2 family protein [Nannocystis sp. ILAH1]|uniref:SIR2 family protein n=1 Tax=Nannocystis sp. ILAH1 TaxID=2996789 RepID=UPI002271F0F8|nr:SIR2 family protein [Nannocystis sp. ILAH1]MCY0988750.1 SIR2 family protein [Nannocystis sp. ILAH1]